MRVGTLRDPRIHEPSRQMIRSRPHGCAETKEWTLRFTRGPLTRLVLAGSLALSCAVAAPAAVAYGTTSPGTPNPAAASAGAVHPKSPGPTIAKAVPQPGPAATIDSSAPAKKPGAPRIDLAPPIRPALPAIPAAYGPPIAAFPSPADANIVSSAKKTKDPASGHTALVLPGAEDIVNVTRARPAVVARTPMTIAWEGQLRYRFETRTLLDYRLPGTFGRAIAPPFADGANLSVARTRLGATLGIAPGVRGHLDLQDARQNGARAPSADTLERLALFNAWIDLDSLAMRPLRLRVGRQQLSYGEGRVLGEADWSNSDRALDGALARWSPGRARVDGFFAWVHEGRITGGARVLSGIDAFWRTRGGLEAEAYHFRRAYGDAAWTGERGTAGGIHDATSGLRARVARGAFELRLERALQRGRRAGDDVRSWLSASRLTVDLESAWRTRLFVGSVAASGDADPTDGTFQRFDPVIWGGHGLQGALDIAGASNLADGCGGITVQPAPGWTVQSEIHTLSLLEPRDAWVDGAGNTVRRDIAGTSGRALGRELDETVRWESRSRVSVLLGISWFTGGEFVHLAGGGADTRGAFAQLSAGF